MRKTHFKFLTFLSGLIEILLGVGSILLAVFMCMSVNDFLTPDGAEGFIFTLLFGGFVIVLTWAALFCLFIAFFICLVLGIMLIVASFRDDRIYEKRKGFIIFTIVCDFLLGFGLGVIGFSISGLLQIGCIIVAAMMLISAIIKIIEIRINKKHIEKLDQLEAAAGKEQKVGVDFSALSKTQNEQSDELEKLEEMKKNGLIKEEEYEKLKNEIKGENK